MKNIVPTLKCLVLLLVTSFMIFSCQDQFTDEVSGNSLAGEDVMQYQTDNSALQHPHTYVLVHGAWHPESCWKDVKWLLERCGNTVITVQLQGLGNDTTPVETVSFQDHVNAVKNVLLQQSEPVILVGHSYAGAVISQAGEEVPQHINKLVYVSGFMPADGQSVVQLALADTQSLVTQNLIIDGPVAFLTQENYGKALYNEALASRNPHIVSKAKDMITKLRPHPVATLVTPLHLTANYDNLSKVYISCLKDKAVTPASQQAMYSNFPGVVLYTLENADHSPFISTPVSLVNILRKQ